MQSPETCPLHTTERDRETEKCEAETWDLCSVVALGRRTHKRSSDPQVYPWGSDMKFTYSKNYKGVIGVCINSLYPSVVCSVQVLKGNSRTSIFAIAYRNQCESVSSAPGCDLVLLDKYCHGESVPWSPDVPGIQGGSREKVKDSDLPLCLQSKWNECEMWGFHPAFGCPGTQVRSYPLQPELLCHGFNYGLA